MSEFDMESKKKRRRGPVKIGSDGWERGRE
jgi:hypothetical protein